MAAGTFTIDQITIGGRSELGEGGASPAAAKTALPRRQSRCDMFSRSAGGVFGRGRGSGVGANVGAGGGSRSVEDVGTDVEEGFVSEAAASVAVTGVDDESVTEGGAMKAVGSSTGGSVASSSDGLGPALSVGTCDAVVVAECTAPGARNERSSSRSATCRLWSGRSTRNGMRSSRKISSSSASSSAPASAAAARAARSRSFRASNSA